MTRRGVIAALEETGFKLEGRGLSTIAGKHVHAGAQFMALESDGEWAFSLFYQGGAHVVQPESLADLIGLLTRCFGVSALNERKV